MPSLRATAMVLGLLIPGTGSAYGFSISFQQGANGYLGTRDTWVRSDFTMTNLSRDTILRADNDNPVAQGLLRFTELQGTGPGQLPTGCPVIDQAILRLHVTNPGDPVQFHRVLRPWSDTNTWESLSEGLSAEMGEIALTPEITFTPSLFGFVEIDVTPSVRAWIEDRQPNHGWALITSGTDGSSYDSAESTNALRRPLLTVSFSVTLAASFCPLKIFAGPTNQHVLECTSTFMYVDVQGGPDLAYQWFKDGTAIPGATNNPLFLQQIFRDQAGLYSVTVADESTSLTSDPAHLTVSPNDVPVRLECAHATNDFVILLRFSTQVADANDLSHYEVREATGGALLAIDSAQYTLSRINSSVMLTLAASTPMNADTAYTITASGIYDYCPGNPVEELPVPVSRGSLVITLAQTREQLTLTWPCIGTLERNSNLADRHGWFTVNNATNPYTRPLTGSRLFYRLKVP